MVRTFNVGEDPHCFELLKTLSEGCPHMNRERLKAGAGAALNWTGFERQTFPIFYQNFTSLVSTFETTKDRRLEKPFLAIFCLGAIPMTTNDMRNLTRAHWGGEVIFSFLARGSKEQGGVFEIEDDSMPSERTLRGIVMLRWRLSEGEAIEPLTFGDEPEEIQHPKRREEFLRQGSNFLRNLGIPIQP